VFAVAGRPQLFVISRAVVASNTRAARRLARTIASRASKEKRLDAATLRVSPRILRGALVKTWVVGRLVGELVYCDPTRKWGRALANQLVRAVRTRMAQFRAPTAWDRLIARANRERGAVDVHTALQAFTLAIGPLPGVRRPSGPVGAADPQTAIDWVTADYLRLPPRDRAAVRRVLNFLVHLSRSSPRARAAATPQSSDQATVDQARAYYHDMLHMTVPVLPDTVVHWSVLSPTSAYYQLVFELIRRFQGKTIAPGSDALTVTDPDPSHPTQCFAILFPPGERYTGLDRRYTLGHETFHCVISTLLYGAKRALNGWLREGAPTWAGCQFAPGASVPADWHGVYARTPDVSVGVRGNMQESPVLFDRTYSGIGFLSLMVQTGLDPWSRLTGMLQADVAGGDLTAYQTAVAGNEQQLLDTWASSYFRLPNYGADWDMQGTCSPPASDRSDPLQLAVANGTNRAIDADPFTVRLYRLDSKADLVHVTAEKGSLRINGSGVDEPHISGAYYCTDANKCVCPPKQYYAGPNYTLLAATPEPYVALTGGPSGVGARIEGIKKDCKPGKPQPKPPGPPTPNPSADNTLAYSGTLDGSGPNGDVTDTVHVAWSEQATSPGNDPSTLTWQLTSLTGTFSQSGDSSSPPCSAMLSIKPGYAAAFGPSISHLPGHSTYDLKVHNPADGEAGSYSPASFQIQSSDPNTSENCGDPPQMLRLVENYPFSVGAGNAELAALTPTATVPAGSSDTSFNFPFSQQDASGKTHTLNIVSTVTFKSAG
jgi:hypothetical protein